MNIDDCLPDWWGVASFLIVFPCVSPSPISHTHPHTHTHTPTEDSIKIILYEMVRIEKLKLHLRLQIKYTKREALLLSARWKGSPWFFILNRLKTTKKSPQQSLNTCQEKYEGTVNVVDEFRHEKPFMTLRITFKSFWPSITHGFSTFWVFLNTQKHKTLTEKKKNPHHLKCIMYYSSLK